MTSLASRTEVLGGIDPPTAEILTPEALAFVQQLDHHFAARRAGLLAARRVHRMQLLSDASSLDFLPETQHVRADPDWHVPPPAPGLEDRRIEITGPTDRKMAINALNSGANVWLADLEDANSPTWANMINGQVNLRDAVRRRLSFTDPAGTRYRLGDRPATIVVRPRGLHLVEKHVTVDGRPISASLFDYGLYMFHCARRQIAHGHGPYFYLPKLENHLEARWWNDVFTESEAHLGLPHGTVRATTLIETITAAFQMEEILYELRDYSAGLNAGRWDYIFSIIKNLGHRPAFVLPDRSDVTMTAPFMRAYTTLLVDTCHKRGAHAIGGMAAFIPRRDPDLNAAALAKVREDKEREARDGFDGSWVAHPGLVPTCREAFDARLGPRPHQIDWRPGCATVTAADLLSVDRTPGRITYEGLRLNIEVTLRYIDAWLRGIGAVAIHNLMEDAATAEISRCQVSQWRQHHVALADGTVVSADLVRRMIDDEAVAITTADASGESRMDEARAILYDLMGAESPPAFFTTVAYCRYLVDNDRTVAKPELRSA
jgi:malate synthase